MKKRLFVTPEYTTAREIKQIRKELHLTQKEFAEFVNCSKPTIERWERSKEVTASVPFLQQGLTGRLSGHMDSSGSIC